MEVHIDKVFPKYWMIMNQIELRRRGVPAAPWICNWYCYLCLKKGNKNIINNYSIFFKSRGDKRTKSLLDKEISWRILKHYDLGKILSFFTADIAIAWILYPIEKFCSRHTFFLWPYKVSYGALQWNFENKMMLICLKVPYYRYVTLSSNVAVTFLFMSNFHNSS